MPNSPLPPSFSSPPGENNLHYFRNACLGFKKVLLHSKDQNHLEMEMEKILNASREIKWHSEKKEIWKKDDAEKLLAHLFREFKRYIESLQKTPDTANAEDLLISLEEIISLYSKR